MLVRRWFAERDFLLCLLAGLVVSGAAPASAESQAARSVERSLGVKPQGETAEITFTLDEASDVAVEVLDGRRRVVRHLGAGLLGPNAPDPFRPEVLTQTIRWDYRDDDGRRLPAGTYTVRLRSQLRVQVDRLLGSDPGRLGDSIFGVAVDQDGLVYVYSRQRESEASNTARWFSDQLQVFNHEGRHQRTLLPHPGGLDLERNPVKDYLVEVSPDFPKVMDLVRRGARGEIIEYMYPGPGHQCAYWRAIAFMLAPGQRIHYWPARDLIASARVERRWGENDKLSLFLRDRRGGSPWGTLLTPLPQFSRRSEAVALAFDAEGFAYLGIAGAIHKLQLEQDGQPRVVKEDLAQVGQVAAIQGDSEGCLLVLDAGKRRLLRYRTDGTEVGSLDQYEADGERQPLGNPRDLAVSRQGAVYLLDGSEILKLDGWESPRLVSKQVVAAGAGAQIAWDDKHRILWVGGDGPLLRVREDAAGRLQPPEPWEQFAPRPEFGLSGNLRVAKGTRYFGLHLDPATEDIYTYHPERRRWIRFGQDGRTTWVEEDSPWSGSEVGQDGRLYRWEGAKLARYTREGRPDPFLALGTHLLDSGGWTDPRRGTPHNRQGFAVDRHGNVYLMVLPGLDTPHRAHVHKYGPDGNLSRELLLEEVGCPAGITVDPQGNLYVVAAPVQLTRGATFLDGAAIRPGGPYNGALYQFPPSGGKGVRVATLERDVAAEGHNWTLPGVSPRVNFHCSCPEMTLTGSMVDSHGRLFVPDVYTFAVKVVDRAGNLIRRVGGYGNADEGLAGNAPRFLMPIATAVSGDKLWVLDMRNNRLVQCRLDYGSVEETTVTVP
jgi:hypothetical protein